MVDFDLKELVVLPREIDLNEWLASNSAYPGGGSEQSDLTVLNGVGCILGLQLLWFL